MSIERFRLLDILIFTLIAVVIDIIVGYYGFFGIKLFFSIGVPVVMLLYIRWGKYAFIANMILIVVHFIVHYVNIYVMIAHSFGLVCLSFAIICVKWKKLQERNVEFHYVFLYVFVLYALMLLVEWVLLIALNQQINLVNQLLNHSLNMFISIGLLYLISRQKDLIINMNNYLLNNVEGE